MYSLVVFGFNRRSRTVDKGQMLSSSELVGPFVSRVLYRIVSYATLYLMCKVARINQVLSEVL